jgi:hypothetical protein
MRDKLLGTGQMADVFTVHIQQQAKVRVVKVQALSQRDIDFRFLVVVGTGRGTVAGPVDAGSGP